MVRLGRSPKVAEYRREREVLLREEHEAGQPPRAFPSHVLIQNRYPTWDEALKDAGLEPVDGRRNAVRTRPRRNSKRISDEEIMAAIREAATVIEGRLTISAYQAWRKEQMERDRAAGRYRRIPEHFCIWKRFGGWARACERALNDPARDSAMSAAARSGKEERGDHAPSRECERAQSRGRRPARARRATVRRGANES